MPRIRIRTMQGERVVGTPNCSVLSIDLSTYAQRRSLCLKADAKLLAGESVIEHWSWEWPELPEGTTIELTSIPESKAHAFFDPPDAVHGPTSTIADDIERKRTAEREYLAAQRELRKAVGQLAAIRSKPSISVPLPGEEEPPLPPYCAFCGATRDEVQRLVAGPGVFICSACVQMANEVLAESPNHS